MACYVGGSNLRFLYHATYIHTCIHAQEPELAQDKDTLPSKVPLEPGGGAEPYGKPQQEEKFDDYYCEFVKPPLNTFETECPICSLVLCDPHQSTCCGTTLCHLCSQQIQAKHKPCPTCGEDNFEVCPSKSMKRSLKKLTRIACEGGDFNKVFKLIKAGQDPKYTLQRSLKPLHYAAFHGNLEAVRTLVEEYGCNPRSAGMNKWTPLHYACYGGHRDVVKYLVTELKCDPKFKAQRGYLPLHLTCTDEVPDNYSVCLFGQYGSLRSKKLTSGHYEVAKFLLTEGGCNVTGSKKCAPPLVAHLACRYGTVEFVQFLIEQENCDPNSQNKDKDTPVHVASKYGHVEILRYLVETKQCSVAQQNQDGNTPLHLACMFQCIETVQYLVRKQQDLIMIANHKKELPTHIACCEDSLGIVKLVTSPSNVAAKAHNGATPLHVASAHRLLDVMKWLIEELHCDPDIKDDGSLTPLHYACGYTRHYEYLYHNKGSVQDENIQVTEYLVANCECDPMKIRGSVSPMKIACKAGNLKLVKALTCVNVNCIDSNGDTPLHLACREKQIEIVRFLIQLEKHCSQKLQNKNGELPLHIACAHGSLKLIKLVSDCDVNVPAKSGDTPVHIACRHSHIDIVTYLIQDKHSDLNIANDKGELPLHIACEQSCLSLVELVSNCNLHTQANSGYTPMHVACKRDAIEIVKYLVQEKQCEPSQHPQLYDDLLIHCACANGNAELVRKLATPTNVSTRHPYGCSAIKMYLYSYSTSYDTTDNSHLRDDDDDTPYDNAVGNTPLHEACKYANIEVVALLVNEFQCNQNVPNEEGELPLHIACSKGSPEMAKLVSNCNVNCQTIYEKKTPLHKACENEALEVVKYLIQGKDCDVALANDEGEVPLHIACSKLSLEMVQLVTNSVVVSIRNYGGNTPLHIACKHGQVEFVKYLTEQYMCDPTIQNRSKELPLHYACNHSLEIVELVSDCDPKSSTSGGVTPLHIACLHRKLDIVRYLIENKRCSPDVETNDGLTLLDYACGNTRHKSTAYMLDLEQENVIEATQAQAAVVRYLMNECDYDPANVLSLFVKALEQNNLKIAKLLCTNTDIVNYSDTVGNTPLHIACMCKCLEVVKFLTEDRKCNQQVKNQAGKLPLHIACECGSSLELVQLVSNCDINAQTTLGDTPLHIACKQKEPLFEVINFLIKQCRCDQTIQNNSGEIPLHIACKQNSLEAVKLFSKCDFSAQTARGDTPLHIACRNNNIELVQCLTEQCLCDQTIQNIDGELPLHIACSQGSLAMVELVSNCEVNVQSTNKQTALQIACSYPQQNDIAHFLVHSKGADPSLLDESGQSLLHEACMSGSLALVKILAVSATVHYRDINGNTPLHIACKNNFLKVATFLVEEFPTQIDPSIQNHNGNLALHIACGKRSLALTKLVSSCDPNVINHAGNTPLHVACKQKAVQCVKYLVEERGCDVSVQNGNGELPLHVAASTKSINAVKLVGYCEVNSTTESGDTPLHIACRKGNPKIVQYLVKELNCDPDIQNKYGELPLHIACTQASLEIVQLVSNCDPNKKTSTGDTALHFACCRASFQKVSYLLEQVSCNPDIQNAKGETPLHIACQKQDLQTIKLIGKFVHNPNLVTPSGDTPLHVALKNIKRFSPAAKDIIKYLTITRSCNQTIANSAGELPLHLACKCSVEFVELVSKCNINSQTTDGNTPLHIACKEKKTDIVKYLTETKHCDVNIQDQKGESPLHIACKEKKMEIIKCLIQTKKCDPNIQNQKGEMPLHIACGWGNLKMARLVCKCNMNAVTTTGDTPLHLALSSSAYCENDKLVKFLISKGHCNFTIRNDEGKLPLHIACEKHRIKTVRLVGKCDVNARTKSGDTPLHIVCRRSTYYVDSFVPEIKYLVKERRCNLTIRNNDNELPLHIACEEHSIEVIRLIGECDVNAKTSSGDTPLHIVCRRKCYTYYDKKFEAEVLEIAKHLVKERHCDLTVQNKEKELPLHIACQNCSLDVVKLVSECDVELQTATGDTPLHIACRRLRGNNGIVDYLLGQCNPTSCNSDGELPLHIACKMHTKLETVKLLCDCDIDVNTRTFQSGDTPLHYACRYNYHEAVKYLMEEKSGNPSIQNSNGQLPLHIACTNMSFKLVELLSNYDADFNCRTLTGDTPLHEVCKVNTYFSDERKQVVQFLVEKEHCDPNCQNNAGMTPLHYACKQNAKEIVLYLLSTGKVGPSVTTKNSDEQTPVMLTDDIEIIRKLLKHGADPHPLYQRYEEFFKECSSETPPPTPFNVLVLGNASTGKTTLIESLKAEGESVVQDTSHDAHTAGIIPNRFESKEYGLVTFYDFAGQHEYYASHEAVIQTIARSTPPAIILLVNINESEEYIMKKILYWLSFISNQFPTVTSQPHLIITGSHADIVMGRGGNPHTKIKSIINSIQSQLENSAAKFVAFTTMDCRISESPGISNLRQHLQKCSKELKGHGVMNFMSHCFHIYLLEYFQHLPAVSLSQITSCLLQKQKFNHIGYSLFSSYSHQIEDSEPKRLLPTKPSEIDSILEELSEKGHVVFLKSSRRRASWVILNKEALLGDINGTVFAPVGFQQYKDLASSSSTGVVPFSAIARHFPKFDPNMIVSFLSHLEFCHVIADEEVLNLIGGKSPHPTNRSASLEPYFLFPHLVSIDHPQNIWRVDDSSEYNCSWFLWCSEDHHFFTSRFLQVILLRLAFSFALDIHIKKCKNHPAIQRRCSIWKNGILWLNEDGIDVLVEMRQQNQVIAVMIRCDEVSETRIECIHLRSLVIQKILKMKEEFCSKVSTKEAFINPDELQYPLRSLEDLTLFSLSDVARSVINKKRFVICSDGRCRLKLENLLLFEPYADLRIDILKELFDEANKDTEVTDEFLNRIANEIVRKKDSKYIDYKKECFLQLFDLHPASLQEKGAKGPVQDLVQIFQHWRDHSKDRSYEGLRRKLDEYSVFCGRNPLVRFSHAILS